MKKLEKHPMYSLYETYNIWENKKNIKNGILKVTIRTVEQIERKLETYSALTQ